MSANRYGASTRTDLKKLAPPKIIPSDQDENFTYGQPLGPPTPIKAVLGHFYGEIAGYQHEQKTQTFREYDEGFRKKMLAPPKSHTRASAMANQFVNSQTATRKVQDADAAKSLFKMKKFCAVEPRTSSKNPTYKPTKREGMEKIGTRPNPIFGK